MNFGIEIEVYKAHPSLLDRLSQATGVRLNSHNDGSIREYTYAWDNTPMFVGRIAYPENSASMFIGLEIVTPVLDADSALAFCRTASRIMEKIPYHPRASIHVHVDVRGRPWVDVANVILAFAHFEKYWYRFSGLGLPHRGIYNDFMYCRPLSSPIGYEVEGDDGETILEPLISLENLKTADTASKFAAAWGRLDILWRDAGHYIPHRLHGINFVSVMRQGSLEFRVFNAVYGQMERILDVITTFVNAVYSKTIDLERPAYTQLKQAFGPIYWDRYVGVELPKSDDLIAHHYRRINIPRGARIRKIANRQTTDDGSKNFSFYV